MVFVEGPKIASSDSQPRLTRTLIPSWSKRAAANATLPTMSLSCSKPESVGFSHQSGKVYTLIDTWRCHNSHRRSENRSLRSACFQSHPDRGWYQTERACNSHTRFLWGAGWREREGAVETKKGRMTGGAATFFISALDLHCANILESETAATTHSPLAGQSVQCSGLCDASRNLSRASGWIEGLDLCEREAT